MFNWFKKKNYNDKFELEFVKQYFTDVIKKVSDKQYGYCIIHEDDCPMLVKSCKELDVQNIKGRIIYFATKDEAEAFVRGYNDGYSKCLLRCYENEKENDEEKLICGNSIEKADNVRVEINPSPFYEALQKREQSNEVYVIVGSFPNMFIDKRIVETEDNFNFCLKHKDTGSLDLFPKNKCYNTYEEASEQMFKQLQECIKENKHECRCSKK